MNSLISIVIPTYNSIKFLPQALQSVLSQTYQNFEVLVIDDRSTDGTDKLFDEHSEFFKDARFKYLKLEKNFGGPAGPRDKGLELAKGEYICFLDSDDIWMPEKLQIQLDRMQKENLDFTSTRRRIFNYTPDKSIKPKAADIVVSYYSLLKKNLIFTSSVMVKSSLIKPLRFDVQKVRVAVEDYEMWLTILKNSKINALILGEYLIYYRLHANNISRAKFKMAKKVWNLLGSEHLNINPVKRAYYFVTYAWHSTLQKLIE